MRFTNRKFPLAALLALISCGNMAPNRAIDVVNDFYEYQHDDDSDFPVDMFANIEAAVQARSVLSRKEMLYGAYISHNRISTSRRISIGKNGKKEVVTYICMVTGENGRTQETLMLERYANSEPFRITAYVIKDMPLFHEPAPRDIA